MSETYTVRDGLGRIVSVITEGVMHWPCLCGHDATDDHIAELVGHPCILCVCPGVMAPARNGLGVPVRS